MTRGLSISQLTFIVGITVAVGGLLVLFVYGLRKFSHRQRQPIDSEGSLPRVADETQFALATVQGVIASLKRHHQELTERLLAAESRAGETAA